MSVEALAIVLHHSRSRGTAKVVLVGIANHDGDGGAWPSVSTLARYANVDARTVQRAVEQLESLHEVRRVIQGGGDHRFAEHERPNRYEILLTCPADCDRTTRHATSRHRVVELDIDPVTLASPGDTGVTPPVTLASPKPSLNQTNRKGNHLTSVSIARATCGHELIDDRHCTHGCPIQEQS
jgi:hypothetical protein